MKEHEATFGNGSTFLSDITGLSSIPGGDAVSSWSAESTRGESIPQRLLANAAEPETGVFLRLLAPEGIPQEFTYRDVLCGATSRRSLYASRGLVAGDRVVIILKHSLDLYTVFLGALLEGIIPAMFAFPSPKFSTRAYFDSIGQLVENAGARLIVTYSELRENLAPLVGTAKGLEAVVVPDEMRAASVALPAPPVLDPEATAFLQFSSGTTGLKKGVAISHRALLWQVEQYAHAIQLNRDDLIISWLPLYHDMGLIACFLLPLVTRTPLAAMSAFDWVKRPIMLLEAITRLGATLCWLPNFAYNFLAQSVPEARLPDLDLSSLRCVVNCSEVVMAESHARFTRRFAPRGFRPQALAVSYAMAENTFAVTSGGARTPLVEDVIDGRLFTRTGQASAVERSTPEAKVLVSSGRPLPDTLIEIVADDGSPLPERRAGEIVLQSPCLLTEYWRNPTETARALVEGRYFTGDLGYLANGELFVTGRKTDLIIVAGNNVHPQDIELLVNEVPGVYPGRCVALGVKRPDTGTEGLVILAESQVNDANQLAEIRRAIFDKVATQTDVVPNDVRLLEHMWLHKSSSGKIARRANLERYLELLDQEREAGGVPLEEVASGGADELESIVRRCVYRALEHLPALDRGVSTDEPLLTSGLVDSFGLTTLILELERACAVSLPDAVLAEVRSIDSIRSIVATIRQLRAQPHSALRHPDVSRAPSAVAMMIRHATRRMRGFWTWYYRLWFWSKGIPCGGGLAVHGPLVLRLLGDPRNLVIGRNVTLMPMVDLKLREAGRIILHDGVRLDTFTRLVAANQARIELGDEVSVAMGTIINAGTDVLVGHRALIGGYCSINSSEHRMEGATPIALQGYWHAPVHLAEDVWLGAHVQVMPGSHLGPGAVVGAQSIVASDIPAFAVARGNPARVIKFRKREIKRVGDER